MLQSFPTRLTALVTLPISKGPTKTAEVTQSHFTSASGTTDRNGLIEPALSRICSTNRTIERYRSIRSAESGGRKPDIVSPVPERLPQWKAFSTKRIQCSIIRGDEPLYLVAAENGVRVDENSDCYYHNCDSV